MQGIYKFTFAIAMIIVIIIAVTILMISCNKIISQLYVRWQKCKIHQQINKNHCQLNNWKKLIKQFSSTCLPFLNVKNIHSTFFFRYSQLNYFVSKCDEFSSVSFYLCRLPLYYTCQTIQRGKKKNIQIKGICYLSSP